MDNTNLLTVLLRTYDILYYTLNVLLLIGFYHRFMLSHRTKFDVKFGNVVLCSISQVGIFLVLLEYVIIFTYSA